MSQEAFILMDKEAVNKLCKLYDQNCKNVQMVHSIDIEEGLFEERL